MSSSTTPFCCHYLLLCFLLFSIFVQQQNIDCTKYEPNWTSLDSRPLPAWFDDSKIGIFIHWGVFAVPSFKSEWFWIDWHNKSPDYVKFMLENYPPNFSYQEFAKDFTAEFFDPKIWADLFVKSGAKYVVLTSKHHEGFTLWPSKYAFSWNAKDIGPHRDIIGELSKAVRDVNLTFGVYHSLYEWFNPIYLSDKANGFETQEFVDNKMLLEMYELVNNYNVSILWSDGDWEANDTYWKSTEFLAWLYNDSPVKDEVVVNDRWGIDIPCTHGGFYSCSDRFDPGTLQKHKWENAMTLDKESWGFRRNAALADYLTIHELITTLVRTISCGGNILINIGPTKEGTINPIFEERLLQLGSWLETNGEAIYGSQPWTTQNDTFNENVWYTSKNNDTTIYAIDLEWPANNTVILESAVELFKEPYTVVKLLGKNEVKLKWNLVENRVHVKMPNRADVDSEWAWVLKINSTNTTN